MSDLRKRGADGTLQRRIFIALQSASMSPLLLSETLGAQYGSCRKGCSYLVQRGVVARHAITARLVIYAAVRGKHPPKDRRGLQAACRNHRGSIAWASWLRMMRAKHGQAWRPKVRAHPLDVWVEPDAAERVGEVETQTRAHRPCAER